MADKQAESKHWPQQGQQAASSARECGRKRLDEHLKREAQQRKTGKLWGTNGASPGQPAEKALPALGFLIQKELAPEKPAKGMWEQVLCECATQDWTPPDQRFWGSLISVFGVLSAHQSIPILFMNQLWSGSLPRDRRPSLLQQGFRCVSLTRSLDRQNHRCRDHKMPKSRLGLSAVLPAHSVLRP